MKLKKPEFINILVNPNQKIIPKLSFGDPIEDLSPKISREEFCKNLIAKPIKKRKRLPRVIKILSLNYLNVYC